MSLLERSSLHCLFSRKSSDEGRCGRSQKKEKRLSRLRKGLSWIHPRTNTSKGLNSALSPRQVAQDPYPGKIWNEKTIKKLIFIVLIINGGMMLSDSSYYITSKSVYSSDIQLIGNLHTAKVSDTILNQCLDALKNRYKSKGLLVVSMVVSGIYNFSDNSINLSQLRTSEISKVTFDAEDSDIEISMVFDLREPKFYESLFSLLSMVFLVTILVLAYIYSANDSKIFISDPISRIAAVLNNLVLNPIDIVFNPYHLDKRSDRSFFTELEEEHRMIGDKLASIMPWVGYAFGKKMVPHVMSKLVLGNPSSLTQIEGDKYCAFFSVVQIKDFMERVEFADPRTHDLVQVLSEIVFRTADQYNAGCTYLTDGKFFLIWKLKSARKEFTFDEISRESSETASVIITTNLKILYGLAYRLKLRDIKVTDKSIAHVTIHCGTVSECLIGSTHKMDVHYFGLDLNAMHCFHDMARLYHTNLLLTDFIYNIIPECMKVKCRKIDVIKFPFHSNPIDIYTIDIRLKEIEITEDDIFRPPVKSIQDKILAHMQIKDDVDERLIKGAKNSLFLEDPDLDIMVARNYEFRKHFRNGIDFYVLGAWDSSKKYLDEAKKLIPDDGPANFLYKYMAKYNFSKPKNWRGFRNF